jgi:glyoxylase-like metal-dependent hydrolase (beta-lactamase superfamily II)
MRGEWMRGMGPALSRRCFTRRAFLAMGGAGLMAWPVLGAESESTLPSWRPGELDIHHIDTGRGNATFLLGPDGTTMLMDCGTTNEGADVCAPARPDAGRQPGEWVARYALRQARAAGRTTLDYAIATHVHPDHVGDVPTGGEARAGGYAATGLSQVDVLMSMETVIDRSYPDYGLLQPMKAPFAANYLAWLDARRRAGKRVERAEVGSKEQIRLREAGRFPEFAVRVLAANGRVWTGRGSESRSLFPDLASLPAAQLPGENNCSIALRIGYGRFSYFTGGDLNADTHDGRVPWLDVESVVVEACGRVEVALADHHAYFDACGPEFVKRLDAQAYVIPAWHVTHPAQAQLERLIGAWPGEKPHDVFATEMLPANRLFNARWLKQMKSTQGHVVVRVAADGMSYRIFVVDSTKEDGRVTLACGPYLCR